MSSFKRGKLKLRGEALKNLAKLSLTEPTNHSKDIQRIIGNLPIFDTRKDIAKLESTPLNLNEVEILFAVCDSVPSTEKKAIYLLNNVIEPYLKIGSKQQFTEVTRNKFKFNTNKTIIEEFAFKLIIFLINVYNSFKSLQDFTLDLILSFLSTYNDAKSLTLLDSVFLYGVINAFNAAGTVTKIHDVFCMTLFKLLKNNTFEDKITASFNEDLSNNILAHYFDNNIELSCLYFCKLAHKLLLKIIRYKFDCPTNLSLVEYVLRIKSSQFQDGEEIAVASTDVINDYSKFYTVLENDSEFITESVHYCIDTIDSLQYIDLELSSADTIACMFENNDLALQVSSLLLPLSQGAPSDNINDDSKNKKVTDFISDFMRAYTNESYLLYGEFLVSIMAFASLLNFYTEKLTVDLLAMFPIFVSSKYVSPALVKRISHNFSIGLQPLTEDTVVSSIYDTTNLLGETSHLKTMKERKLTISESGNFDKFFSQPVSGKLQRRSNTIATLDSMNLLQTINKRSVNGEMDAASRESNHDGSRVSSSSNTNESKKSDRDSAMSHLWENVITAAITIASVYNDQSITVLTITILTQKVTVISSILDRIIFEGLSKLAPKVKENEFVLLTKYFKGISTTDNKNEKTGDFSKIEDASWNARSIVSGELLNLGTKDNPLYKIYLKELLTSIISEGEVENLGRHRSHGEISLVASRICKYLKPLALLLPDVDETPLNYHDFDAELTNMFRNIWFNMAVHGFSYDSPLTKKNKKHLRRIAHNSPPLASDFPKNTNETSLEMNTILRRGTSNTNLKEQKSLLSKYLSMNAVQSKTFSDSKLLFLTSTILLENFRCDGGSFSSCLAYFSDPAIERANLDKFMGSFAKQMVNKYITLISKNKSITGEKIASELADMLMLLLHRNSMLQSAAFQCCGILIQKVPISLSHSSSLYRLLDILTLLFDSVVDCQIDKYGPRYEYHLKHSADITVLLPFSETWRSETLKYVQQYAEVWLRTILNGANQDVKVLLQSYISDVNTSTSTTEYNLPGRSIDFGVTFAIEMASGISSVEKDLSKIKAPQNIRFDTASQFLTQHSWRSSYLVENKAMSSSSTVEENRVEILKKFQNKISSGDAICYTEASGLLELTANLLVLGKGHAMSLVSDIVYYPFKIFTPEVMSLTTNIWLSIMKVRKDVAELLLSEIVFHWTCSIDERIGLYSNKTNLLPEEWEMMEYAPYNKKSIDHAARIAERSIEPHQFILEFFNSHFQGTMFGSPQLLKIFAQAALYGLENLKHASLNPFAITARLELVRFSLNVLDICVLYNSRDVSRLSRSIISGALTWFKGLTKWPFGSNQLKMESNISVLKKTYDALKKRENLLRNYTGNEYVLLLYFMNSEMFIINTWLKPMSNVGELPKLPESLFKVAFNIDPILAFNIAKRYSSGSKTQYDPILSKLVNETPLKCIHVEEALAFLLVPSTKNKVVHNCIYWKNVSPIKSINMFLPPNVSNKFLIQFNVRSLESHDVNLTFFYVPQIVQCLRYDPNGYVERFILDTAKISMLFSHQIIWNMLANSYKDDEGMVEDSLKPKLDKIRKEMISKFSPKHKDFYEREFGFFNEITSISGKLKPYIKKTKAEKKQKIDQEMSKIVVAKDVYLPSNPDGVVIDIDRLSGKPLQSHAKAPFMATFKICKKQYDEDLGEMVNIEKWQSAIFKVGDDCRQDVLTLQLISVFRTIWSNIGLDVYVFPYRVTATAPGCGVIDVLPNSISRDMLGREAVNGLYEYFVTKFGDETTIEFQRARSNFVKSLAGYSVISYLLQFKDRHNGNIMYDDQGHCLHIDFGFIFDIVPGGVKFEAVPFKLTKEMVRVMGGSPNTAAYCQFEELCVKAYLAARSHMDTIVNCVVPMLDSGLPCFKGLKTIRNLQNRFTPDKTDNEAAMYMKGLIKKSYESYFTKGYDEFQKLTNGIPF
ncbi:1-phosphatidylinositol 4-kinase STT4 SCDLUD_001574 [Saccharomycodes ludwigii]|uniref:1-phosphatidylinositol 4-kinase STT4 n=1 Tax=Saccharomycodes ludwigii TaxID=36035 RepID=UPI001E8B8D37|nr:hypothetical protein SCDLUD_001574 [Saccharomycodes ludwigii]KAH3901795.1 hypothetical protein SCDLUD_001574 [Saccharomycodes ludwigii]